MKKREIKILILTSLFIISLIMGIIFFEYIDYFDKVILKFIRNYLTCDIVTKIMNIVSAILTPVPMIAIFILFYVIVKDRYAMLLVFMSTVCSILINVIFKHIFRRDRPFEYMIGDASGYSFPSAHSMVCVAFYGTIIYSINKLVKNKIARDILSTIFLCLIILTPISRVYLGVHNFTDILIGVLVGYIIMESLKYALDKILVKK